MITTLVQTSGNKIHMKLSGYIIYFLSSCFWFCFSCFSFLDITLNISGCFSFSLKPVSLYSHHSRLLMRCLTLILGRHAHSVSLIVFSPPSKSLKVFFFLPFYSLIKSPVTPATHPASGSRNSQSGRQHVPIQTHTAIHKSANNSQPIRHTDTPPPHPQSSATLSPKQERVLG